MSEDKPEIIIREYNRQVDSLFVYQLIMKVFQGTRLILDQLDEFAKNLLGWVATVNNIIIGTLLHSPFEYKGTKYKQYGKDWHYLDYIAIDKNYRKCGLGTKLMSLFMNELTTKYKGKVCYLHVEKNTEQTNKLKAWYGKYGFKTTGRTKTNIALVMIRFV